MTLLQRAMSASQWMKILISSRSLIRWITSNSYFVVEGEDALENHELFGFYHSVLSRHFGVRDEGVNWNAGVLQVSEILQGLVHSLKVEGSRVVEVVVGWVYMGQKTELAGSTRCRSCRTRAQLYLPAFRP